MKIRKLLCLSSILFIATYAFTQSNLELEQKLYVNENLRLRSEESTSSNIITTMKAGSYVKIIQIGKADSIDGIKSNWVKVETINAFDRDGKSIKKETKGWCYGGYLSESKYEHAKDPRYWTIEKQKAVYIKLLNEKNIEEVINFRNFTIGLAQYHHDDPIHEYNPLFLCYESYPQYVETLCIELPTMFTVGNIENGDYSEAPVIYVLKNKSLKELKMFFDYRIPFNNAKDDVLYGTLNRGGPRFPYGGNILLFAKDEETVNYLITQGIPESYKAPNYSEYFITSDNTPVYEEPGTKNKIICKINKTTKIQAETVLAYHKDGYRWVKVKFDENEGWVRTFDMDYDTGI